MGFIEAGAVQAAALQEAERIANQRRISVRLATGVTEKYSCDSWRIDTGGALLIQHSGGRRICYSPAAWARVDDPAASDAVKPIAAC